MVRQTSFSIIKIGLRTTVPELCGGGERLGWTPNTDWAIGNFSQGTGWRGGNTGGGRGVGGWKMTKET